MPLMSPISSSLLGGPHTKRLSSAVGINELDRHQFVVVDGVSCCDAQGIFEDSFDWSPDVDDLEAAFEESLGFIREVVGHAEWGCGVGLVDVHALDGATKALWDGNRDRSLACILN